MGDNIILDHLTDFIKTNHGQTLTLAFFTILIVSYSVFVFYFYRHLAKKNIINLNLRKYNTFRRASTAKFFGLIFYLLEYIIILPILTVFWFSILAIFLFILAKTIDVSQIMLITAALIASVRITAYISERLSQDLAKMLPFTLLALAIIGEKFFSLELFVERLSSVPLVINDLPYFLLFVIAVELILRLVELARELFLFGDDIDENQLDSDN